jgi:hypothetical protein
MGKYDALRIYLKNLPKTTGKITLTFKKVEIILSRPLPNSARKHSHQWWANDQSHVQARAWLNVEWKTESKNILAETVDFVRN